nr:LEA family epithelial adhesin [Limosilactobacillus reuteri]
MMKRPEFLETKRTPRYSLRKLNVGVASVLLGVTIFGINFTDHSVKAATTESVATEKVQQTTTQEETSATGEVQRSSGSNNATANNSTKAATTPQSSPETQGSADTDIKSLDIRSLTAISAAKLATMNLMQTTGINGTDTDGNAAGTPDTDGNATGTSGTNTGRDRSAAVTVNRDNINTQPAKENQKLANEHNLSSSDNYSSNIYKGTDGKYYKIITIYGNDYVYRAADIQASGANLLGRPKQTAKDIKNNINISKEDLGNGKTRWTVVFFPNKGLQNYHSTLSGLSNAKFGIALTSDYQIVGNVDMDVISDPKQSFVSHTFKDNSNSATDIPVQNPSPEVKFSFNPNTDVDPNTGLINSKTMPAYNNKYLQGPYYFTTATSAGTNNLWQTYFKDADERKNAYDGTTPYLGGNHDFHVNTFKIANETGVDGAKYADSIIYDKRGGVNGVFSSDNFNQAMEFKSQGYTGNGQSQFSSYVISFTTQHTDSHEVELTTGSTGSKNQQFSGISANIYSFQNGYYSMMSSLYGEQRALDPAGALVEAKKIIPHWGDVKPYMDKIKQDYLNNAQINVLRNKILNNITDPAALNNIVSEGNSLNGAMKKLGNSIGQYDDGNFADHKEDTTKASDRYKYASPDKQEAYDNATEVTKALINKDTGTYADQATVEKLTEAENDAWSALDGKKPTDAEKITPNVPATKVPVADTTNLTETEKDQVKKNVEDANKGNFPDGTTVTVGNDGTATVTYPDKDKSSDTINGSDLVRPETDAEKITPNVPATKVPVADTTNLTETEKDQVKKNVEDANKGNAVPSLPTVTVVPSGKLPLLASSTFFLT